MRRWRLFLDVLKPPISTSDSLILSSDTGGQYGNFVRHLDGDIRLSKKNYNNNNFLQKNLESHAHNSRVTSYIIRHRSVFIFIHLFFFCVFGGISSSDISTGVGYRKWGAPGDLSGSVSTVNRHKMCWHLGDPSNDRNRHSMFISGGADSHSRYAKTDTLYRCHVRITVQTMFNIRTGQFLDLSI